MKISTGTMGIIIAALFLWIFLQNGCHRKFFNDEEVISSDTTEVVIDIPEKTGSIDKPVPSIDYVEVEVPKYYPVSSTNDKELIEKYKRANDSLKQELYKQSTTRNTFEETFEDSNIKATVKAEVGGSNLYSLSIPSYTVKRDKVTVPQITNTVIKKKYHLSISSEVGIPTKIGNPVIFKGGLDLKNKNNMSYKLGYDTEQNIWAGVSLTIF